ncbi:hypothetical protein, partial [Pandoraea communis]|uniref:hypothetical protein n=1 Tax=Pandoraea communis TaxID=2508297 RepID=UPI001C2D7637
VLPRSSGWPWPLSFYFSRPWKTGALPTMTNHLSPVKSPRDSTYRIRHLPLAIAVSALLLLLGGNSW